MILCGHEQNLHDATGFNDNFAVDSKLIRTDSGERGRKRAHQTPTNHCGFLAEAGNCFLSGIARDSWAHNGPIYDPPVSFSLMGCATGVGLNFVI